MSRIPSYVFLEKQVEQYQLENYANEDGLWYESEAEVAEALARSRRKYKLLREVRQLLDTHLTPRQRMCVLLHYFEGKTIRETGVILCLHWTTVHQHVQAGVTRLQRALREAGISENCYLKPLRRVDR